MFLLLHTHVQHVFEVYYVIIELFIWLLENMPSFKKFTFMFYNVII